MFRLAYSSIGPMLLSCLACGGDLPRPPYVGQPTEALAPIPQPPPPARVEVVLARPASGSVWIDGEWIWQGRTFAWRRGRWVKPPAGARFSPWTTIRAEDGTVYYAGGVWRDEDNRPIPDPPALATSKSTVGPIVDVTGHDEETGHNVHDPDEVSPDAGGSSRGQDGGADSCRPAEVRPPVDWAALGKAAGAAG